MSKGGGESIGGSQVTLSRGLRFVESGETYELPAWAHWLADLGAEVAGDPDSTLLAAISVPTRKFAACLCAAGAAIGQGAQADILDQHAHFQSLAELPHGSYLIWRQGDRLFCGSANGFEVVKGIDHLSINGGTYKRRWDMTADIRALPEEEEPFIAPKRLTLAGAFIRGATGEPGGAYVLQSRLSCVIVGLRATVEAELTDQVLLVPSIAGASGEPRGCLQELARCRTLGHSAGTHFRSDLLPVRTSELPARLREVVPSLVIFDGASAYIRWKSTFTRSRHIVVLDRTAASASEGASVLAAERARSHRNRDLKTSASLPAGVEFLAFDRLAR